MPSLQEIVSADATSGTGKRLVGYTVGAYSGVLSALQKANRTQSSSGGSSGVLGNNRIDWETVGSATYDNSGFSSDVNSGVWKMAMTFNGSLPILHKSCDGIEMKCLPNDSFDKAISQDSSKKWCPYILNNESIGHFSDSDSFAVGGYIDMSTLGVKYFTHFYGNPNVEFDSVKIAKLIEGGYIMAQISFPDKRKIKLVKIIGQLSIGNAAAITISLPIIGTKQWKDLGFTLNGIVTGNVEGKDTPETGEKITIIPSSGQNICKFYCEDASYDSAKGSIASFDVKTFKNWLNVQIPDKKQISYELKLEHIVPSECLVRLYVPSQHKQEAIGILGGAPRDIMFQEIQEMEYVAAQAQEFTGDACSNANTAEMLKCIEQLCNERGFKRFETVSTNADNKNPFGYSNYWYGPRQLSVSTAMAGRFVLPAGWPMCVINPKAGSTKPIYSTSGNPPSKKGLKNANGVGDNSLSWIYCVPQTGGVVPTASSAPKAWETGQHIKLSDRLDSALNTSGSGLKADILNGNMPQEWYKERLKKAHAGAIVMHCQSAVQAQMQNFFNEVWGFYSDAANLYNQNKPENEKVSTGELMLRCVPSLCSWHGATPLHRNRLSAGASSSSGHDAGAGIDLGYYDNLDARADGSEYKNREIYRRRSGAYRPMLHYLYKNKGGWGGEYPFMPSPRRFDAMHIQFNTK